MSGVARQTLDICAHGQAAERRRAGSPLRSVDPAAGPLLVLGAPRSSQTLLAFALGQHPGLTAALDTSWLARLGPALHDVHAAATRLGDRTALAAAGASRGDLLAAVGAAVAGLLVDAPPVAWVTSGTVATAADVAWLLELFPGARIIHVIRHPDAAVTSLATKACGDGRYASPETGYGTWVSSIDALIEAERAYGSRRVARVDADDLHADPHGALTRCLALLGLPFDQRCTRALRATADERGAPPPVRDAGPAQHERRLALRRHAEVTAAAHSEAGDPDAATALLDGREETSALSRRASDASGDAHRRYQQFVALAVPAGATIAVVSKGDPALLEVPGRHCWHLPRTADGRYTGYHPADSCAALTHLDDVIRDGARWLVVPGASSWWLNHYGDFAAYLRATARCIAHHDDLAAVYALPAGGERRRIP
jgi:hypothetical protein